jgi:hypothetical protein
VYGVCVRPGVRVFPCVAGRGSVSTLEGVSIVVIVLDVFALVLLAWNYAEWKRRGL